MGAVTAVACSDNDACTGWGEKKKKKKQDIGERERRDVITLLSRARVCRYATRA